MITSNFDFKNHVSKFLPNSDMYAMMSHQILKFMTVNSFLNSMLRIT